MFNLPKSKQNERRPSAQNQGRPPQGGAGGSRPGGLGKLLKQVWDAGYTAGHSHAMRQMSDEPHAPKPVNPYDN